MSVGRLVGWLVGRSVCPKKVNVQYFSIESNLDKSKCIIVMVQTIPELIASQACFIEVYKNDIWFKDLIDLELSKLVAENT